MANPIQEWLDRVGLPWRVPRAELAFDAGLPSATRSGRDRLDVAFAREPLDGLVAPFAIRLSPLLAPYLPPTEFSGRTSFGPDARHNLERTAGRLAATLGPAPIETRSNSLRAVWTAGRASVSLSAWPADMQPAGLTRPSDPPPDASCHVTVQSGFVPRMSADEREALSTFQRLGAIGPSSIDGPAENVLELVREDEGTQAIAGSIGMSADRRFLAFHTGQLYVVPVRSILRLQIERLLPAKGSGGSALQIVYRPDYDGPAAEKNVKVGSAPGPDDMTLLGTAVADALRVSVELGDYQEDC